MWSYNQSTGELSHNGIAVATGYSGHGIGKNNPDAQDQHDVGPLPRGWWKMTIQSLTDVYESKRPPVIRLTAMPGTETFGRDGFLIHGDSISDPGSASLGCMIENHTARVAVAASIQGGDDLLHCA